MIMKATSLPLAEIVLDLEFDGVSYDFHNDYSLVSLDVETDRISCIFRPIHDAESQNRSEWIRLQFLNAEIQTLRYSPSYETDSTNSLYILQRMRADDNGVIVEEKNHRALLGIRLERHISSLVFWCTDIVLTRPGNA